MPTSLASIAVHIIFGTKNHIPCLTDDIYPYIHGIITNLQGTPIRINGTNNHIHILCFLPKEMSISECVRTIKTSSTKWFKDFDKRMQWQTGYAAYSVSKTNLPVVNQYILNQKEHHKKISFKEEMKKYLSNLEEKEVWNEWFGKPNEKSD
jgi:putative transposase